MRSKLLLIVAFGILLSCGDRKTVGDESGSSDQTGANATALPPQAPESLFTQDPETLDNNQLQVLLTTLINRDESEKRELALYQPMNKALCERLQQIRSDCVAAARLIPDGSEQILGCDGGFEGNASIAHTFEIELSGVTKNFNIIANKVFISDTFGEGTTKVNFKKSEGATDKRAPRFMDIASFRIKASAGSMPPKDEFTFRLYVDEELFLDQDDFLKAEDDSNEYYRLNPQKIFEFKSSEYCKMSIAEVTEIKNKILQQLGPDPATQQAQQQQIDPITGQPIDSNAPQSGTGQQQQPTDNTAAGTNTGDDTATNQEQTGGAAALTK